METTTKEPLQFQQNNITWRNLPNPSPADLVFLQDDFGVAPNVIKELAGFNKRPKIEEDDNYLFLVIHFPVFDEKTRETTPTELDFIVTQNSVVTVYQQTNPTFENFFEELKNDEKRRAQFFKNSGYLMFGILDKMIDSCLPMLDHIHEKIEETEKQVFEGKGKEMLKEISLVKRDIIDFRRTLKPQRSILEILGKKASRFFKTELESIAQEVIGSEVRVWNTLENHKEMIEAIEETNQGLLSFQINQIMRTLTVFSIIIFSLTFIATFFTMRVDHPWLNGLGLWSIMGLMAGVTMVIIGIFKGKRWM